MTNSPPPTGRWTSAQFHTDLARAPLVAVLRGLSPAACEARAVELLEIGVAFVEVTIQDAVGLASLHRAAATAAQLGFRIGAGSVKNAAMARQAVELGAAYLVSPGFSESIVEAARDLSVPILPGVATPSEVQRAIQAEIKAVKVFPAEQLGGPAYIRALAGPFPELSLIPTGGVDLTNADSYLEAGALAVGIGGALTTNSGTAEVDLWLHAHR